MTTLIVASHGNFAQGLLSSAEMIFGPITDVTTVTLQPSQGPDDLIAAYQAVADANPDEEILILADLFGGSPYNAGARFAAGRPGTDIVTGVSLPMLLEVLTKRRGLTKRGVSEQLTPLTEAAQKAGTAGVRLFSATFKPATTTVDPDEGDEL